MKKIKFTLTILSIILVFACNNEDDSINNTDDVSIVGKLKIIDYQDGFGFTLTECEMQEEREFKTDGALRKTYFFGNNCQNSSFNDWIFTVSENKLFTNEPNGGFNSSNDYVINYNILELNSTILIIEGYYVDEGVDGETPQEIPNGERFIETWERIN